MRFFSAPHPQLSVTPRESATNSFLELRRFDDHHENGKLSDLFWRRLSGEVRVQTGKELPIFYDRNDIEWGQQWQQRIDESLDAVTFLVPIITPSFFNSPACRRELERFLDREKRLNRNDLILPVYYVTCEILTDPAKLEADSLAKVMAARQHSDWRDLRFEAPTSPEVGKKIAEMAIQIAKVLERGQPVHRAAGAAPEAGPEASAPGSKTEPPPPKIEPPTLVVDAFYRGNYPTLTDALQAAKSGDRILVRRGLYQEGVVIDKPVEIIGDGDLSEVVIEAKGKDVVLFRATMGRIVNLTLRQAGGEGTWYGVDIAQGRLELDGCDITSQGPAGVAIHGGAYPRLRLNRIHDCKQGGVFVNDDGKGTLEDNEIFANGLPGVVIGEGSNLIVRRNRIHDGGREGIYVQENGQGTFENNEIFANGLAGVEIKTGGNATLRHNRISGNGSAAIRVYDSGGGVFEDNDLRGNARGSVGHFGRVSAQGEAGAKSGVRSSTGAGANRSMLEWSPAFF